MRIKRRSLPNAPRGLGNFVEHLSLDILETFCSKIQKVSVAIHTNISAMKWHISV